MDRWQETAIPSLGWLNIESTGIELNGGVSIQGPSRLGAFRVAIRKELSGVSPLTPGRLILIDRLHVCCLHITSNKIL